MNKHGICIGDWVRFPDGFFTHRDYGTVYALSETSVLRLNEGERDEPYSGMMYSVSSVYAWEVWRKIDGTWQQLTQTGDGLDPYQWSPPCS